VIRNQSNIFATSGSPVLKFLQVGSNLVGSMSMNPFEFRRWLKKDDSGFGWAEGPQLSTSPMEKLISPPMMRFLALMRSFLKRVFQNCVRSELGL